MAPSKLVYNTHGKKYEVPRERVSSLNELQRGDHIAFHQHSGAYWHHAIVEDINNKEGELNVIEYSNTPKGFSEDNCIPPRIKGLQIAKVVRTKYKFQNEDVYLLKHEECLNPDEVVSRAQSKLGEEDYNPFTNNCEHLAMWCKTEKSSSDQVNKAKAMVVKEVVKKTIKSGTIGHKNGGSRGDTESPNSNNIKSDTRSHENGGSRGDTESPNPNSDKSDTKGHENGDSRGDTESPNPNSDKSDTKGHENGGSRGDTESPNPNSFKSDTTGHEYLGREIQTASELTQDAMNMATEAWKETEKGLVQTVAKEAMKTGAREVTEEVLTQTASKATQEAMKTGAREVTEEVLTQTASKTTQEAMKTGAREGTEEVVTGMGLAFSIVAEGAFVAYDIYSAYADMKKKKINEEEFKIAAKKRVMTGAGNVGGSTLGSAIGQVLIPVPLLGGLVGGVVGGLSGSFVANLVGNARL